MKKKLKAFTLAEVLITLAIVGVVVVLVMPMILENVANKKYEYARTKALASIGEATRQIAMEDSMTSAVDAKDFVENYLSKKLSIIKTCDITKLKECGIETGSRKIKNFTGGLLTMPTNWNSIVGAYGAKQSGIDATATSYGFVMSNGYSVNLFYNPNCTHINPKSYNWATAREVCVHAIYDMNGLNGPNQYWKDMGFVTVLYPTMNSIAVSPQIHKVNVATTDWDSAVALCEEMDARLPSASEYASLYLSKAGHFANHNWSGTMQKQGNNFLPLDFYDGWGALQTSSKNDARKVHCVKK